MNRPMKILFITTSQERINATNKTGLWQGDFAIPFREFKRSGYEVAVASPRGGAAPVEMASAPDEEDQRLWMESTRTLQYTRRLDAMRSIDYDGIFLCGGHGAMFDLPGNPALQTLLADFVQKEKVIGAVGHGVAALVNVKLPSGHSLVDGRTITGFTDAEEQESKLDRLMPFLLETRLRAAGATFINGANHVSHQEQDGNLITGQNPQSALATARTMIQTLEKAGQRTLAVSVPQS